MARRKGVAYAIYRVCGAGSDEVSIISLRNPFQYIGVEGGLELYLADGT